MGQATHFHKNLEIGPTKVKLSGIAWSERKLTLPRCPLCPADMLQPRSFHWFPEKGKQKVAESENQLPIRRSIMVRDDSTKKDG